MLDKHNNTNDSMTTTENQFVKMLTPTRFRKSTLCSNDFEFENPFESDYFRIITSAPFRRLQDKTQIFPLADCDFVRRRLTHSLEVSAYGERLGRMVEEELVKNGKLSNSCQVVKNHNIATILKVAGLVHDIGNPPFGHFGEQTIQEYFSDMNSKSLQSNHTRMALLSAKKTEKQTGAKEEQSVILLFDRKVEAKGNVLKAFSKLSEKEKADLIHFDGNVQGFRVLRHLGLSMDDNSFNLTMPMLSSIIKYPFDSTDGNKKGMGHICEKFGYFQSEKDAYERMCQELGLAKYKRHPLAYLLEAADDIANVTSDVEDGWKMGIITSGEIEEKFKDFENTYLHLDEIKKSLRDTNESCGCHELSEEALEELAIKEFRIRAVRLLINEAAKSFVEKFNTIVTEAACGNPTVKQQWDDLWDNNKTKSSLSELQKKTYSAHSVLKSELQGEHIITSLLDLFLGAMFVDDAPGKFDSVKSKEGKLYNLISENYRRMVMKKGEKYPEDPYRRFQLVIDFIVGMTDSYAMDYCNELMAYK